MKIGNKLFTNLLLAACYSFYTSSAVAEYGTPVHGFAIHNSPKYQKGFLHFDYVNPKAPKAGKVIVRAGSTTFDSLNPFILKGTPAAGLSGLHQHDHLPAISTPISESLMISSLDEPFTMYGLIAETIEVPKDRTSVKFRLRPEAQFQDGSQIVVDDVIFSFNILTSEGAPLYRAYFGDVDRVEETGDREVTFFFRTSNNELPLILGEMPILSRAYWINKDFQDPGLISPLGSGPYRIKRFEPGRFIEYERNRGYWGADLPVNVGRHNFDSIRFDYYRDQVVEFEAFLAGEYDIRYENSARNWSIGYKGDDLEQGRIVKEEFPDQTPSGMQGFVYNTRQPVFADREVRKALAFAFDFPWTNKTIFYDQYERTRSYYENSELAAIGLPVGLELEILEPYRDQLPPELFDDEYRPPTTNGSGNIRENLLKAQAILKEAGWSQEADGLKHADGTLFTFEILLRNPTWERIIAPFIQNLKRIGINATVRTVDTSQWVNRVQAFDFDMIVFPWGQTLSPGNEQRDYWGSAAANQEGSRNFSGIKDQVVDELIEKLILANTREGLVAHVRALDRVLQWGYYVIPHWHTPNNRVASWNKFSHPEEVPLRGVAFSTWWYDKARATTLDGEEVDSGREKSEAIKPDVVGVGSNPPDAPDDRALIVLIAIIGMVLLLWNLVRRRSR